ncbi:MAG: trypsin-like peptidase domain-containing protein [Fusobacteriaceae bacterium]|nr:trypsin-like peptidase domain-containing protein [Fusobacteriaceae bacterium]MBN2837451.1 trypsin-like peptidase domain-containing protein [Fusobacteriaceae bacterium]
MSKKELSKKLRECVYSITVFEGDEIISKGSGVCIHPNGHIISALHVVTVRFPFSHEELIGDDIKIIAISGTGKQLELNHIPFSYINPIESDYLNLPIYLDLVVLAPKQNTNVSFFNYSKSSIELGEDVLICGFPEDSKPPFYFTEILTENAKKESSNNLWKFERSYMIKSGMIGYNSPFNISFDEGSINGDLFYVDTELHSGGSGGAVVNLNGELVGIISERAIIKIDIMSEEVLNKTEVPSGISVAISPRTLLDKIIK